MVSRSTTVTIAFAAGMATVLLAFSLMFHTAPGVILADDMLPALSAAADRPLKHFPPGSLVYVKSALGPMLLETLHSRHPYLTLRPYSERMEATCADRGASLSDCERDDYLKLEVLSSPTRGSLLIAMATSKAFGQMLVVDILGHWWVLMERTYSV
jgi:hypothetical protein